MTGRETRTRLAHRAITIYRENGLSNLFKNALKMMNYPTLRLLRYKLKYSSGVSPMVRLIQVDPNKVNHLVTPRFQMEVHNRGYHIRDGDWDTNILDKDITLSGNYEDSISERGLVPFNRYGLYKSLRNRYQNDCNWEDTEYFQWEVKMLEKGIRSESISDIESRCKKIDNLYYSMKSNGYKTQDQMNESYTYPERHEVMIDIGRDGQLFLDDGRHRMCIAKLLDLDSIPVKILVRHKEWQKRRTQMAKQGVESTSLSKKSHPDLRDVITTE